MKKIVQALIFASALATPFLASAQATCKVNGEIVPCENLKGVGMAVGGFFLVFLIISLLFFVFWLWMLIHAISKPIENKVLWIILMFVFGPVVSIIYYFVVKRKFQEPMQTTPAPQPLVQQPPVVPPAPVA